MKIKHSQKWNKYKFKKKVHIAFGSGISSSLCFENLFISKFYLIWLLYNQRQNPALSERELQG